MVKGKLIKGKLVKSKMVAGKMVKRAHVFTNEKNILA